jgi:tetratricopeptide (TPR) repeat protein
VLPYAAALLASGISPDEVVREIERRVTEPTPTIRFMLATALFEAGEGEAAEGQYRLVLKRQPHSAQARVALAEVLLYQSRFSEAAAEAAALPNDDPLAGMAVRTELFGRIAAEEFDQLPATRERALAIGLPLAEVGLFDAWAALECGDEEPPEVALSAIGLLGVVLEALLRVERFDSFEKLVGALRASALAEREQHELLAMIYLRRGFVASAAEEWMEVCQRKPDVRALVGLGRIAQQRGMTEDVAVFASQALELEPGNQFARALMPMREAQAA